MYKYKPSTKKKLCFIYYFVYIGEYKKDVARPVYTNDYHIIEKKSWAIECLWSDWAAPVSGNF